MWASLGLTWIHLDSLGFIWIHWSSLGFTLTHLDSLGLTFVSLRYHVEFTSTSLRSHLAKVSQGKGNVWSHKEKGKGHWEKREKGKGARMSFSLGFLFTSRNRAAHARTKRNDFPVSGGLPKGELTPPNLRYDASIILCPVARASLAKTRLRSR